MSLILSAIWATKEMDESPIQFLHEVNTEGNQSIWVGSHPIQVAMD